jgi:para-aminobenzoate synthetase component 1
MPEVSEACLAALKAFLTPWGPGTTVRREPLAGGEDFLDLGARFADQAGTVLLMSGGDLDCARHHILGLRPWLTFKAWRQRLVVTIGGRTLHLSADPLAVLQWLLRHFNLSTGGTPPLAAGLLGYLAYDLKDVLERLPRTALDRDGLPFIWLQAPSLLVVEERSAERRELFSVTASGRLEAEAAADRTWFDRRLGQPVTAEEGFACDAAGFASNFHKGEYLAAVERIRAYIAAGDVYQVNLSQRFATRFAGAPFALYRHLFAANPAPFFAFLNAGDHQVLSTSPERFLKLDHGGVETRPIKGTRPRCADPREDRRMRTELSASPKDDAELSMIVDLLRNDIGRVCRAGSVRVAEHKRLEAYRNVYHLVSVVQGELDPGADAVDLIRATFPGGSITGCPKIRAMEIIDELEPDRRHIYTGAIGYLSFHGTMDLSIAIRTATLSNNRLVFNVGGGVVYDSDAGLEYEETLHKGRTLLDAFQGQRPAAPPAPVVWLNGRLVPEAEARLPALDQGVLYGFGFFETFRVHRGRPLHLAEHLARLAGAWTRFFQMDLPDLTWEDILAQLIARNGLAECTAAVRITTTRGTDPALGDGSLLVTARPYRHRLEGRALTGLGLVVYPWPRQTPLADVKSLNYLYYLEAGRWAASRGADEALVLNPDGSLSETNSANVLVLRGSNVLRPLSPHVLPGVMETAVCAELARRGWRVERKPLFPTDLYLADQVWLTNSLMGAVPATHLDGARLPAPDHLWREINLHVGIDPPAADGPPQT